MTESLTAQVVSPLLQTSWLGCEWRWFAEIGSTNDEAKRLADEGAPHGLVVFAETQTKGRGRMARTWFSPSGENAYLSVILRPQLAPSEAPPLALVAGLAIAESVEDLCGIKARLKWPNDVRVNERKLAGVLTEMAMEADRVRHIVLGVGLNVNTEKFPEPLDRIATSLRLVLGDAVDRRLAVANLCRHLERRLDEYFHDGRGQIVAAFRARAELGRRVRVETGAQVLEGIALDIDANGVLLLRTESGVQRIISGEIECGST